ncbi:MAG: hypothetical protein GDA41_11100 [Rhodospirillales bacterium]|nr:hypothetical protein [Rhodospirillales bacterium]
MKRHFLFVQAPFGEFSKRLAARLRSGGHRVTRVILNGGDLHNWGFAEAHFFLGRTERYRDWIAYLLKREVVSDVISYGDGHYYTEVALEEAKALGLRLACLEQGYLRPNWVTLELDGVNGNSSLPDNPSFYRRFGIPLSELPDAHVILGNITRNNVLNITAYSFLLYFLAPFFPFYRLPVYMPGYVTGLAHLFRYYIDKLQRGQAARDQAHILSLQAPFFLGIMQRPGDSQLVKHSEFPEVRFFYRAAIESFARNAPAESHLLFKCHPLDQGFSGHARGIRQNARQMGVAGRVHFLNGGSLAPLVRKSVGVITVNSTAGLAALNFGTKCKTLGKAIYNIEGLTFQGPLDSFWQSQNMPDKDLFLRFRQLMVEMTQVLGSFSTKDGVALAVETIAKRLIGGLPTPQSMEAVRLSKTV